MTADARPSGPVCSHCGMALRAWRPSYYTNPQEDPSDKRVDGREHSPDRCRDVLRGIRETQAATIASLRAELEEAGAAMRSDTGESWEEECMRARGQRDDALVEIEGLRAIVRRCIADADTNVMGRQLADNMCLMGDLGGKLVGLGL